MKDSIEKAQSMAEAFGAKKGKVCCINSKTQSQRYRHGYNNSIEKIQVTGSGLESETFEPVRCLLENHEFSAVVHVVFGLKVK